MPYFLTNYRVARTISFTFKYSKNHKLYFDSFHIHLCQGNQILTQSGADWPQKAQTYWPTLSPNRKSLICVHSSSERFLALARFHPERVHLQGLLPQGNILFMLWPLRGSPPPYYKYMYMFFEILIVFLCQVQFFKVSGNW